MKNKTLEFNTNLAFVLANFFEIICRDMSSFQV